MEASQEESKQAGNSATGQAQGHPQKEDLDEETKDEEAGINDSVDNNSTAEGKNENFTSIPALKGNQNAAQLNR